MKEQEKILFNRLVELNKNNGLYNCKLEALAKDLADHLTAEQGELEDISSVEGATRFLESKGINVEEFKKQTSGITKQSDVNDDVIEEAQRIANEMRDIMESPSFINGEELEPIIKALQLRPTITEDRLDGITPEVAWKLLKIRDAYLQNDWEDVWHYLYSIASPNFDEPDAWKRLEELAGGAI